MYADGDLHRCGSRRSPEEAAVARGAKAGAIVGCLLAVALVFFGDLKESVISSLFAILLGGSFGAAIGARMGTGVAARKDGD